MKVNKAKRPEGFGASQDSKAPDDFRKDDLPNRAEVLEGMTNIVSAKKDVDLDTTAAIDLDAARIIESLPSNYKESLAEPEIVELTEEKKEYVYQIPEGYEHLVPKKPEPVLSEEVIVEEKIEEEVVEPKSPMEILAERLSGTDEKREVLTEEEKRFQLIERQLIDLRKITLETAQGTIVHGLGHMSPGSGEVILSRMDDVDATTLADGDTLVWDATLGKWIPSHAIDGGQGTTGGQGTQIDQILQKLSSFDEELAQIKQDIQSHMHPDDGAPPSGGDIHDNLNGDLVELEYSTNMSFARSVDLEDNTHAYIALETFGGDHFHITDATFIVEVEGGTQFNIPVEGDVYHPPVLVEGEAGTDATYAREIDFTDGTLALLAHQDSDQHAVTFTDGDLIIELEGNTLVSLTALEVASLFSVEAQTASTNASAVEWDGDIYLLGPEGTINPVDLSTAGDHTFVELENDGYSTYTPGSQSTTSSGATANRVDTKFFDYTPDGDTTRFRVTLDEGRGVYRLDDVPQPTIQLPRGDIIEFEITELGNGRESFTIFSDGVELTDSNAIERFPTLVRVNTAGVPTSTSKLYYRHRTKRGLGWVIVITDN